jgi:ureidoacrylate peracid hydrolase
MVRSLEKLVHPGHSVVLIVDVQNDGWSPDGALAKGGADLSLVQAALPRIQSFVQQARERGVPLIFVRSQRTAWTESLVEREQRERVGQPAMYMEGNWGAEICQLAPQPGEGIVTKNRASAFLGTRLDLILGEHYRQTVVIVGGSPLGDLDTTISQAFMLGYQVVVPEDCAVLGPDVEEHAAALQRVEHSYGVVTHSSAVAAAWATAAGSPLDPPHRTAVLVIDPQNDACNVDGVLARSKGVTTMPLKERMMEGIQRFLPQARAHGVPVIFVRIIHNNWSEGPRSARNRARPSEEIHELEGTWGADWCGVAPEPGECVVDKPRFSAFMGSNLDLVLRSQGISRLLMTGGGTNACVESTVRDAAKLGYKVEVLEDCTGSSSQKHHELGLAAMGDGFATIRSSGEIVQEWTRAATPSGPRA